MKGGSNSMEEHFIICILFIFHTGLLSYAFIIVLLFFNEIEKGMLCPHMQITEEPQVLHVAI